MSVAHLDPPDADVMAEWRRRFRASDLERMVEVGVVRPGERVELVDGLVQVREETGLHPRRFTVAEFERLAEVGILEAEERVELIDGALYTMSPVGSRHAACVDVLSEQLLSLLKGSAIVRIQNPIALPDATYPQPDVVLARPRADRYRGRHPGPGDILLVVEVMDTSAIRDRGLKLAAYARAGIPELWLVDLDGEVVEVHVEPALTVYGRSCVRQRGDRLAPALFPEAAIEVTGLFD
jgi:Uma2 family endonuclease